MIVVVLVSLFVLLVCLVTAYYARTPGRHAGAGIGAYNARTLANPVRRPVARTK
ncbi:hypothetical protein [Saccharopolyspora hattusasensis]|uniref:hypothetical protein n=1 Tax=Saccharopolyspora hattusasensis TaxID=1128679 RepID=UPI003D951304